MAEAPEGVAYEAPAQTCCASVTHVHKAVELIAAMDILSSARDLATLDGRAVKQRTRETSNAVFTQQQQENALAGRIAATGMYRKPPLTKEAGSTGADASAAASAGAGPS